MDELDELDELDIDINSGRQAILTPVVQKECPSEITNGSKHKKSEVSCLLPNGSPVKKKRRKRNGRKGARGKHFSVVCRV